MPVPNPYIIHIELFWPNETRPNQNEIARVDAFESNWTWRGQCGWNQATGGWMDLVVQNAPPLTDLATLRFRVTNTAEQEVHLTVFYSEIQNGSTIRIIIGESDELIPPVTPPFVVNGSVTNQLGGSIAEGTVEVSDVTLDQTVVLGTVAVDSSGQYFLSFPRSAFEDNGEYHTLPNLVARYFDAESVLKAEASPSGPVGQTTTINLVVQEHQPNDRVVFGEVKNPLGRSVANVWVELHQVNWKATGIVETPLGSQETDGSGKYSIPYSLAAVDGTNSACQQTEEPALSVVAKASSEATPRLAQEGPFFNVPPQFRVDLVVDRPANGTTSEYSVLYDRLWSCFGTEPEETWATLNLLKERPDLFEFTRHKFEVASDQLQAFIDAWLITGKVNADVWSEQPPKFLPEVTYGLIRGGLGNTLSALLSTSPEDFFDTLVRAIQGGTIGAWLETRLEPEAPDPLQADWREVLAYYFTNDSQHSGFQSQLFELYNAPGATKTEIAKRYFDFQGTTQQFIASLTAAAPGETALLTPTQAEDLEFLFAVYEAIDKFFPATKVLYQERQGRSDWKTLADLAKVPLVDGPNPTGSANDRGWYYFANEIKKANRKDTDPVGWGRYPGDVPGKTDAEKRRIYAERLFAKFGGQAPETRFTAEVAAAAATSGDPIDQAVAEFLEEHAKNFELKSDNLRQYLNTRGITLDTSVLEKLLQLQRVWRLTTSYTQALALISVETPRLDSAVAIAQIPEDEFIATYAELLGGLSQARGVHRLATRYATEVMSTIVAYHKNITEAGGTMAFGSAPNFAAFAAGGPDKDDDAYAVAGTYPNWVTLFGVHNNCADRHCQTVLSPGAYFVDLIRFLPKTAKNTLWARRPTLQDIEITCANTERAVPYIDLANEVLEAAIAPQVHTLAGVTVTTLETAADPEDPDGESSRELIFGLLRNEGYPLTTNAIFKTSARGNATPPQPDEWIVEDAALRFRIAMEGGSAVARAANQTSATADAPDVFPEHLNQGAYATLEGAVYPFVLPLALGKEETELILSERRLSIEAVRNAFRTDLSSLSLLQSPAHFESLLGLTPSETSAILSQTLDIREYWGFTNPDEEFRYQLPHPTDNVAALSGTWLSLLSHVGTFLQRSGLKFDELVELIEFDFIHGPTGASPRVVVTAEIADAQECNYFDFLLLNLEENQAQRLSLFIRLWRRMGVPLRDLDRALMSIDDGALPTSLGAISALERLRREMRVPLGEIVSWIAPLDTRRTKKSPVSPYDALFLTSSTNQPEFQIFESLRVPGASTTPMGAELPGVISALRLALRVNKNDFDALMLTVFGNDPLVLSLETLSSLARIVSFCRAIGISVESYREVRALFGLDPFSSQPNLIESIAHIRETAFELRKMTRQGLTVAETAYLLNHADRPEAGFLPTSDDLAVAVRRLSVLAREVREAYPATAEPSLEQVGIFLTEIMPAERVARALLLLEPDAPLLLSPDDQAYLARYLAPLAPEDPEAFVTALAETSELRERNRVLGTTLRAYLTPRARTTRALALASELFGLSLTAADLLLQSGLIEIDQSDPVPALNDWTNALRGGFSSSEETLDALEPTSEARRASLVFPSDGSYHLIARAWSIGNEAPDTPTLTLTLDGVEVEGMPSPNAPESTIFTLGSRKAGAVVALELGFSGDPELRLALSWTMENGDPVPVPPEQVIALSPKAYVRLDKAVRAIRGLRLSDRELAFLARRTPFLPNLFPLTSDASDTLHFAPLPWSSWSRLLDELELERSLPLQGTSLFELWANPDTVFNAPFLASLTTWAQADLEAVLLHLSPNPASIDFAQVDTWKAIAAALEMTRRLDLPAERIIDDLVDAVPDVVTARALRASVRTRYTEATWREVFKPLRDRLRQKQRDALISYLTTRFAPAAPARRPFTSANDLFAHYLLDVEMEPDTQISRLRLALNTVQLFVQRALLGLEGSTNASALEAKRAQWEWMQQYRVWEANRKVFLFPENWLEPELRDDKTQMFREFEDELLQDDVTGERARQLLSRYIEKLDEVAHLDIVGMCEEAVFSGGRTGVLHIVARTRSEPAIFYHRTFEGRQFTDGIFSAWRRVDQEIQAPTVTPAFFNGRLHLFWIMAKTVEKIATGSVVNDLTMAVEIRLMWTAYTSDTEKWQKPRLGKAKLHDNYFSANIFDRPTGEHQPETSIYHLRTEPDRCDGVAIEVIGSRPPATGAGADYVHSSGTTRIGVIRVSGAGEDSAYSEHIPLTPAGNHPAGGLFWKGGVNEVQYKVDAHVSGDKFLFVNSEPFFGRTPGLYRVVLTNFGHFAPATNKPFVYMTERDAFFAVHHGSRTASSMGGTQTQVAAFQTFHHPLVPELKRRYLAQGPKRLFDRETQALPAADGRYYYNTTVNQVTSSGGSYCSGYSNGYNEYGGIYLGYHIARDSMAYGVAQRIFELDYKPGRHSIQGPYPLPTIDFRYGSSFGTYNWELFFHLPLLVATRLSRDLRFEDALEWFHLIFDPRRSLSIYERSRSPLRTLPVASRYWNFLPFFANRDATDSLLETLGYRNTQTQREKDNLRAIIEDWKNNPFNPHLIARQRIVAYQKSVLMKYLDNLLDWADQLFRRDTFETINQATQLYILADEILGRRPEVVENFEDTPRYTFRELEFEGIDLLSNALVEVESALVGNSATTEGKSLSAEAPENGEIRALAYSSLYFRIPRNDRLDGYWDKVADRLFKIRNSMNIDGVKRQLALFEPPIDPALLVRAAAHGLDLGNVLAQLNRQLPFYRFNIWVQKAVDLANEVKSFGQALLGAIEKRDAEELSLIRQSHEVRMLGLVQRVREEQVKEAEQNVEALRSQRLLAEDRLTEHTKRLTTGLIANEVSSLSKLKTARDIDLAVGVMNSISGGLGLIPEISGGFLSFTATFGGNNLSNMMTGLASALGIVSTTLRSDANEAATIAGYERRAEDWALQQRQAQLEIAQIDKQIVASEIRAAIAQKELDNHLVQREQTEEVQTFLKDKFTNRELYQWMSGELSRTYQQVYKLAYDVAKTAERAFEFELGVEGAGFLQFGYVDSLRQGLLAGEKLGYDLKRMEVAYLEKDKRELEITKSISLAATHPGALQTLRESGATSFDIDELLFDLDFPGHYFRRIQAVRLTIPCVTGPYTSVSAKLSLLSSAIRKTTTISSGYAYEGLEDTRFVHDVGGIQSIATSTAQDDTGLFELNFRDERYLPFEGAGAISRWRLELPTAARQFDYHSISDIVLTISYTARDAGGLLKTAAEANIERLNAFLMALAAQGSAARVFSLKREFPDALHKLLTTGIASIGITPEHFPYLIRGLGLKPTVPASNDIVLHAIPRLESAPLVRSVTLNGGASAELSLLSTGVLTAPLPFSGDLTGPGGTPLDLTLTWSATNSETPVPTDDGIDDVLLLVNYELAPVNP